MQRKENLKPVAITMTNTAVVNASQPPSLLSCLSFFCMPFCAADKARVIDVNKIDYSYPHLRIRY